MVNRINPRGLVLRPAKRDRARPSPARRQNPHLHARWCSGSRSVAAAAISPAGSAPRPARNGPLMLAPACNRGRPRRRSPPALAPASQSVGIGAHARQLLNLPGGGPGPDDRRRAGVEPARVAVPRSAPVGWHPPAAGTPSTSCATCPPIFRPAHIRGAVVGSTIHTRLALSRAASSGLASDKRRRRAQHLSDTGGVAAWSRRTERRPSSTPSRRAASSPPARSASQAAS